MEQPQPANNPSATGDAKVFDYQASLEQIGGETDLLHVLIGAYLEQAPSLLARLVATVASKDAPGIRKAAHALASSVSVFSAERVRAAAKRVEEIGLRGDLSLLDQSFETLREEIRLLDAALNQPGYRQAA